MVYQKTRNLWIEYKVFHRDQKEDSIEEKFLRGGKRCFKGKELAKSEVCEEITQRVKEKKVIVVI